MIDLIDRPRRAPHPPVARLEPPTRPDPAGLNHRVDRQLHRPGLVLVLLPLRLFLAAGWLRAGVEKLIEPTWWNGQALRTFLTAQHNGALPFFRPVMDHVIAPAATPVALVVMFTQIACGVAIAVGKQLRLALSWGFLLNVTFILAGRVNPSAFYLVMEAVMLFAIADGAIGVRPTSPSRRTVMAAGVAATLGLSLVPFIRTIEPGKVIEDPAMMLSFMGSIIAVTLLFRRAAYRPHETRWIHRLWTRRVAAWMYAKPRRAMSNAVTVDRRGFAPPPVPQARTFPPPNVRRHGFVAPRPTGPGVVVTLRVHEPPTAVRGDHQAPAPSITIDVTQV
jgi:thiosulfate dehydrogenase (quinone) large subunit